MTTYQIEFFAIIFSINKNTTVTIGCLCPLEGGEAVCAQQEPPPGQSGLGHWPLSLGVALACLPSADRCVVSAQCRVPRVSATFARPAARRTSALPSCRQLTDGITGKVMSGPGNSGQHLPDVIAAAITSRAGGARPAGREGDARQQGV
ncbi:hypothetical protein E2C01_007104 [Portunus trituberculatus]|uniref:Uncharacterized protein n=1 Tax=Portunus trituberculatus TaxID=210409 RepID=A0A5B7CY22_PORTR|nr:hypothetical protein [Portunus trituberculatus]